MLTSIPGASDLHNISSTPTLPGQQCLAKAMTIPRIGGVTGEAVQRRYPRPPPSRRRWGRRHAGGDEEGDEDVSQRVTVRGEAWPGGPDLRDGTSSGAPGAQVASVESASAERGGTSQRVDEAARTSPAEVVQCVSRRGPQGRT